MRILNSDEEHTCTERARQGDLAAFNRLVTHYETIAFNLSYYLLGDSTKAEAVVAGAVLKAFKHMDDNPGAPFHCWLLRLIVAACRDRAGHKPAGPSRLKASCPDLSRLTFEQQCALLLADAFSFPAQEIALVLDRPEATIKQTLWHARSTLCHLWFQ